MRIYAHGAIHSTYVNHFLMLNYGGNLDFLGNFHSDGDYEFGAFGGVSVGVNTTLRNYGSGVKSSKTQRNGIDFALNAGLRTSFYNHHSLEFFTRFAVLRAQMRSYRVGFRYVYSFKIYTQDLSKIASLAHKWESR